MVPTAVVGSNTFSSLSVASYHTCGVTVSGTVLCWGRNFDGELGNGTQKMSASPVAVAADLAFASVTTGSGEYLDPYYGYYYGTVVVEHSCGVTTARVVYCWGSNANKQLGTGTNEYYSLVPVKIAGQ